MRSIATAIAAAIALTTFTASAQSVKQVEVTNLPEVQAVEIVRPPMAAPPPRFQLVGSTSVMTPGNIGVLAMARLCGAEFTESRLCTTREVMETVSPPSTLADRAWVRSLVQGPSERIEESGAPAGSFHNCQGWSGEANFSAGMSVDSDGRFRSEGCASVLAVACCALVP